MVSLKWLCLPGLLLLLTSQAIPQELQGKYRLEGIQDMYAEFVFYNNKTFEFSYNYGSVDRKAGGSYSLADDTIILKSNKEPGDDFEIIEQDIKGKTYKVVVRDENSFLTQKVKVITYFGELRKEYEANADGVIDINTKNCEKIYLQHELYPDVATLIKDELNANTYFEVRIKPSLQYVSFEGVRIRKEGDILYLNDFALFSKNEAHFVRER